MRSTEQGFVTSILYILGCRTLPKPVISCGHDLAKGNNWSYRDLGNKVLRLKKKKEKRKKESRLFKHTCMYKAYVNVIPFYLRDLSIKRV